MDFALDAVTDLITETGVKVKFTSTDGKTANTVGAYITTQSKPQASGSALIRSPQRNLYVPAGRYTPNKGDFVELLGQKLQVKDMRSMDLNGKPVVFVLQVG